MPEAVGTTASNANFVPNTTIPPTLNTKFEQENIHHQFATHLQASSTNFVPTAGATTGAGPFPPHSHAANAY